MPERISLPFRRLAVPSARQLLATLAFGLGTLWACATAQAQSLTEVYEAARSYDATYLAARAQAESVQYATEQAYALRRPSVGLSASVTRSETDPPVGNDRTSTNRQVGVSATQPLFNRANSVRIEQAERSLEIARADLEAAEQDLIVRVATAYFDVLAAQDALGTARANKKAIEEQLASAKRNFEVGTATITDTREAQARYDLATAQEIAAENQLRTAQVALDQLVGRTGVTPRPLAAPVSLPAIQPEALDVWVSQAETSPTVRRALLGLEIASLETERARAGHLPTVDLVGDVGRSRQSMSPPTATQPSGTYGSTSVGVQLRLPLFAGFSVQNRVKETLLLEERARNDLDAARRAVDLATRQAYLGLQSGLAQVRALEAAEASSRLALEATQTGYRVGVRVNLDVLNAQTQLFTTQRDLARARYDVLLGRLRLEQAAGQLDPTDLQQINALLAP
ncbi:MAG TPA: TolC family outer membrane protein [Burkholderiaceae bacterium]|nr:TolC family outer membrane protein [Burkholderiaceae bacterium]